MEIKVLIGDRVDEDLMNVLSFDFSISTEVKSDFIAERVGEKIKEWAS